MKKERFVIVKWIWDIYRPFRKNVLVIFFFIALSEGLNLLSPVIYGNVINSFFAHNSLQTTLFLVGLSFLLYVLNAIVGQLDNLYELKHFDYNVQQHVSNYVLEKNLSFSMGQHISSHSGVKQSIINRGEHSLTSLAFTFSFEVIPGFLQILFITTMVLCTDLLIGLIVLLGVILFFVFTLRINKIFNPKVSKMQTLWQKNGKLQHEFTNNVSLIQSHAQEPRALREYSTSLSGVGRFGRKLWGKHSVFTFFRSFVSIITRVVIMIIGVIYVYNRVYLPGYLLILFSWSAQIFSILSRFGRMHRQIAEMYGSVKKLYILCTLEPEIRIIENPVRPERFFGDIEFRNVSFSYPQRSSQLFDDDDKKTKTKQENKKPSQGEIKETLHSVNFSIVRGQTVAFVGPSGAGKTTIANLLLRAFDPTQGQIIIDGNDMRVLDLKHYRKHVGVVEQSVSLFDNTLRYNILFGLNGEAQRVTEEQLTAIARTSCVDKFFDKLEKGFDTYIGERGVWLSGGERQRVGIARALAKNPEIMIFDEATSSLDSQNESIIRESINKASIGRTTIIIAHRLSTVKDADKILVFDQGKIVGEGTHQSLLKTCVQYQNLVQKQVYSF